MTIDRPVGAAEFAARMERLGYFEPRPVLAIAVSGGADSLALCLLVREWAQARGGSVLALTVDHRLRLESTREAETVGQILAQRAIAHETLPWLGDKPKSGIQAAAREARYRLLIERCAAEGILHLMLGHHREDQAETLLLRLAKTSGIDGLAAMPALYERPELRLLRPLLDLPKARLIATCHAAGLVPIEDPSNRSPAYARARLRAVSDLLDREGLSSAGLAATAHRLGQARAALDDSTAALLAGAVVIDSAGFIRLDPKPLVKAPEEIGRRALARCLATIGPGRTAPPRDGLDRLFAEICAGCKSGRTFAGCRIVPYNHHLLIVREASAVAPAQPLPLLNRVHWDRRFLVRLNSGVGASGPVMVGGLNPDDWKLLKAGVSLATRRLIPEPARAGLPVFRDDDGVLAVPHLHYQRVTTAGTASIEFLFAPPCPLAGAPFAVV
ncbi:MAG: tRNA lysidine(34) synthetase TilS [Rhodospirillaceae bacterium]